LAIRCAQALIDTFTAALTHLACIGDTSETRIAVVALVALLALIFGSARFLWQAFLAQVALAHTAGQEVAGAILQNESWIALGTFLILSSQGQRLASLARLTSTWIAYIGPTHGVLQLVSSVASTALVVVTPGCLILASLATGISSSAAGIGFTGEATGETISKVAPLALVITCQPFQVSTGVACIARTSLAAEGNTSHRVA